MIPTPGKDCVACGSAVSVQDAGSCGARWKAAAGRAGVAQSTCDRSDHSAEDASACIDTQTVVENREQLSAENQG